MSRRKHLLQSLDQEIQPPGEGQHIVRAVGSRGSNIIEVEFPDARTTLCLLPAKFHKKLWIKKGNYLIVEEDSAAEAEGSKVTGQILAVLFAEHVKQLRRMPGVWPPEFESSSSGTASQASEQLAAMGLAESDSEEGEAGAAAGSSSRNHNGASPSAAAAQTVAGEQQQGSSASGTQGVDGESTQQSRVVQGEEDDGAAGYSSSEDDLPPIPRFNNRKVIEYEVSESESEED